LVWLPFNYKVSKISSLAGSLAKRYSFKSANYHSLATEYDKSKTTRKPLENHIFIYIRQYYLPDYDLVTKDYLKELLAGTRGYIKLENLKPVSMPYWGEIGVKHQY